MSVLDRLDPLRWTVISMMALIDSLEFVVLGEPTPEHAAPLSSVPGAQFYSEVASI
jgi:hypothetical protein